MPPFMPPGMLGGVCWVVGGLAGVSASSASAPAVTRAMQAARERAAIFRMFFFILIASF